MASDVSWGYWDDGPDEHRDHRFNWDAAGDPTGMAMRRLVAASKRVRSDNPGLRADNMTIAHEDPNNRALGFVRELYNRVLLVVMNLSEQNFGDHSYNVHTRGCDGQ